MLKEKDLLERIQEEKINYARSHNSEQLSSVVSQFFQNATPLDIQQYLKQEDGTLPGKVLTCAILYLFTNKNPQSIEDFFTTYATNKFAYKDEVNWHLIFNSLGKNAFQSYNVTKNSYHKETNINKNSIHIKYIEKFGNLNLMFKEESIKYDGTPLLPKNDNTQTYIEKTYGGSYYQHLNNNPEKLSYLLEKDIPFSHIKNLFFEAVQKEDTKTIAKVLHSKYSLELAKDSDVHNFFLLDMPENDKLIEFKKEVLNLLKEIENYYKELLEEKNDRKFLKHKKI